MKKGVVLAAAAMISQLGLAGSAVLTCSNYEGTEALADFPLLVRISPTAIQEFSYDGLTSDLISFKDADGNELSCEVDTWNPGGESLVWVKVPTLTAATKITFEWGKASGVTASDVWSGYTGVWHFNEGTSGTYASSGSTANNAKAVNGATATASGAAKVGDGVTFTRGTNKANTLTANNVSLAAGGPMTFSGWWQLREVRKVSSDTYPKLFTIGGWSSGGYYMQCGDDKGNDTLTSDIVTQAQKVAEDILGYDSKAVLGGSLHHVVVTIKSGQTQVWIDGVKQVDSTAVNCAFSGQPFALIGEVGSATVDEIRLRNSAVSEDWIKADYQQQNSADGKLYVVGGTPPRRSVRLTCSNYQGSETLANFPMLVRISPTAIPGFSYAGLSSNQIVFRDSAGKELPCDVDTWNPSGESLVWVKVPSLTAATTVTMRWGEVRTADPADVWSAYDHVWHLNETDMSGRTFANAKSTLAADGDPSLTFTSSDAKVGQGVSVDMTQGSKQAITTHGSVTVTKTFTYTGWYKLPGWTEEGSDAHSLLMFGNWDSSVGFYLQMRGGKSAVQLITPRIATDSKVSLSSFTDYRYIVVRGDGEKASLSVDGAAVDVSAKINNAFTGTGVLLGTPTVQPLTVSVDEFRLSSSNLSDDWINADYQQQNSAGGKLYVVSDNPIKGLILIFGPAQ